MALNMIELLKSSFNDELIGQMGKFVNEEPAKTKSALGAIFPALLGVLINKGSSAQGSSEILGMITRGGFGADTLKDLAGSLMSGGDSAKGLLNTGMNLLNGIFGGKTSSVTELISNSSGVSRNSASSLLALAVPAVLGLLGKEVQGSRLNASGLMSLLAGQADFVKNLAPAGLASALGVSSLTDIAKSVSSATAGRHGSSIWKWLLPLVILAIAVAFLYRTCSTPRIESVTEQVTEKTQESVGKMAAWLGEFMAVTLPNGVELRVPELGVERKLLAFIQDTGRPVDETTWFSFDRLEFETGSATLKPSSMEQLNNIAQIMKAYPQVSLKIGGYTDSTGSPEANLALSQQRAENTMRELANLGIEASRLEAEGYGEKYPVADNATEEGRQKNRRIDIRVTAK